MGSLRHEARQNLNDVDATSRTPARGPIRAEDGHELDGKLGRWKSAEAIGLGLGGFFFGLLGFALLE
jgi:hypothetical protein